MNKLFLFFALLFVSVVYAADITRSNTVSTNGAINAAKAVLKAARKSGHTVSVAIIDRSGRVRLLIADDNAGPQTEESAKRKAFTAVSFGRPTSNLTATAGADGVTIHDIPGTLFLGGGVPITYNGAPIGAIGVGGAPSGTIDEQYALAGLSAIHL
ncbi:hypothetical protein BKA57DRAFT_510974 [Linnemannia elongata]|uniref:Secreted protein n=1 Tax=Linnemannia elongata AG-77 TaxID=1314771 RepID=A0A197JMY4_9FUNG|nr:hypothetical protein BGZ91_011639 [Linnemannia elongata]KAG0074355.1 hypothetical protein BGZ90_010830 [Linnemannia elongata]KAH7032058.1 hypothetical protein BKA57DRAFT_510974 [Linnemannia elongata]KAK5820628.1 hypothetical protein F5H01DRAFT_319699 [Linnemannia elongata]OAQ26328.1 secreted protein [Linnemannia elongata AG-77]